MIPIDETVAVLLCAGLSTRFGEANKLLHPLHCKPLVSHAARMLLSMPFKRHIAVVGGGDIRSLIDGFELAINPAPEAGQDGSVRIGIEAALDRDPQAVLICLADMPYVTDAHLRALAAAADSTAVAASTGGNWRSPPLLLPARLAKMALERPEMPVRNLLAEWRVVEVPAAPEMLRDFDTPADFAQG